MAYSQTFDERDSGRFTLADYGEGSSGPSRLASMSTADPVQKSPYVPRAPSRPGALALHDPNPYGSSSRAMTHSPDQLSPTGPFPSSSRSAQSQSRHEPFQSLPRSFDSAPSFSRHPADAQTLPTSRSFGSHTAQNSSALSPSAVRDFSQPSYQQAMPRSPQSPSLMYESQYIDPLPSSQSYSSQSRSPNLPHLPQGSSIRPLASPPGSYSSGVNEAMQYPPSSYQGDHGDADSMHDVQEKVVAPPISRGVSSGSRSLPWYRQMTSHTLACKLFLATVVTELVINLAIEANILWRFHVEINSGDSSEMELENSRRLPIYLIIYGLAYLWTLVLTVVAIRARNTVQIVGITAFNFAILAYAVIQIYELRKILGDNLAEGLPGEQGDNGPSSSLLSLPLNILTAVVIAVVATGSIILIILSYFIRRDFGWDRYRFLGADLQIRKFYFRFQIFECIAYFSAFFCAGFGIQFIWLVLQKTDVEYIITWIMFPLSILLLIMGRFAAKYENRYLMGAFEVGLFAGCAYFVFKLIRIWQQTDTVYDNVVASLTTFDALSLLSLMACFIGGAVVWSNFGKGLKEALSSRPQIKSVPSLSRFGRSKSQEAEVEAIDMTSHRISIV